MASPAASGKRSFASRAALAFLVGVLGFVLTLDLRIQERASEQIEGRRRELAAIAAVRQRHTADLEQRLARLRAQLDALTARSKDADLRKLRALSAELALATGTLPVEGPGITVTLSDAEDPNAALTEADVKIQDIDIQSVVNDLWAAGAEAVAVNGQRIVGTSPIRNAGGAVLVNFKVVTSPYQVAALGDGVRLRDAFERSETARHFKRWTQIYGLGYSVGVAERLELPGYTGVVRAVEARVTRSKGEN